MSLFFRKKKLIVSGCSYTANYAKINKSDDNRFFVSKGKDINKDQSYALWGISQKNLSRTIFPLGNLKKSEIRNIAKNAGYNNLVKKSESYEICFVPDNDYRNFLKNRVEDLNNKVGKGNYIDENGSIIGKHEGYPFYTIGQRKGLGLALGYPAYVTKIDSDKNEVTIGSFDELKRDGMYVNKLNFMKYDKINNKMDSHTKVRYNDRGNPSIIEQVDDTIKVYFGNGVNAISPGQAAVFYENDDIIGGGWIKSSFDQNKVAKIKKISSYD